MHLAYLHLKFVSASYTTLVVTYVQQILTHAMYITTFLKHMRLITDIKGFLTFHKTMTAIR